MIIPEQNRTIISIYRCPICEGVFQEQTSKVRISCLVNHPPGSCCHFGEKVITEEVLKELLERIGEE